MKKLVISTLAVWVIVLSGLYAQAGQAKLNIIFIMADDLRPEWVDFDGSNLKINTPNLERFAKSGMVFNKAYVAATVCSPTRPARIAPGGHCMWIRPQWAMK